RACFVAFLFGSIKMRALFAPIDTPIKRAGQQLAKGGQALLGRHHARIGGEVEDDVWAGARPWTGGFISRLSSGATLAVCSTHPWAWLRRTDSSERSRHCGGGEASKNSSAYWSLSSQPRNR